MQALYAYNQQGFNKLLFSAANQAAQAVSVALSTTYTGICLSNPNKSNVNLYLMRVSFALSVAPAAIATIGLIGGQSSTDVTHSAALTPGSCFLGYSAKGFGLVDSQATLPVAPVWLEQMQGGFTAAALPSSPLVDYDFKGGYCIPPGGFVAIGALTAVTGLGSISWLEFAG